jgi:hypothetical protein
MPSTARPVMTIGESFMLSNGRRLVRINHKPSKSIPRFLPAKLLVIAIRSPCLIRDGKCRVKEQAAGGSGYLIPQSEIRIPKFGNDSIQFVREGVNAGE